jgi:hypothetical protein
MACVHLMRCFVPEFINYPFFMAEVAVNDLQRDVPPIKMA